MGKHFVRWPFRVARRHNQRTPCKHAHAARTQRSGQRSKAVAATPRTRPPWKTIVPHISGAQRPSIYSVSTEVTKALRVTLPHGTAPTGKNTATVPLRRSVPIAEARRRLDRPEYGFGTALFGRRTTHTHSAPLGIPLECSEFRRPVGTNGPLGGCACRSLSPERQLFSHLKRGVRRGKMEKREKGEWAILKLDRSAIASACLFHFSPSPFFLITQAGRSFS
jgi:hypothetical protein